ncbi:hypothetical protein OSB04_021216 [Centaurea solstitialis]|uniref:Reverse transcriptase Ty1/copia-type domain-containing protein n=1 Tax=Centaurea solstitialis TaxID=347529 RepID=A0AA38T1H0_9ASTR|nr:hypothetical protein OSB04_021216 [Centaurea solstitialis]
MEFISKEDSGSNIDLEEIQETTNDEPIVDTSPNMRLNHLLRKLIQLHHLFAELVELVKLIKLLSIIMEGDTLVNDKTFDSADEPSNYKEAMAGPEAAKWKEAMESEIQSMYDNHVWELVDHTPGRKTKTNMDGNVHTFKARLVAKGYTQTQGIDYDETFSPVAKIKSIRILLAIAAFHDYEIWQMNVKTAFLNGKLDEDVYMAQPEGFVHAKYPDKVCKLKKSIYGLKQASRSWNLCFHKKIKEFGFSRIKDESCVYVKASGSNVVFLVLYVDDILFIGNNVPMLQDVKIWLGKCFAMKDLGNAACILGIRIYQDRTKRLVGFSQSTYLDKIFQEKSNFEMIIFYVLQAEIHRVLLYDSVMLWCTPTLTVTGSYTGYVQQSKMAKLNMNLILLIGIVVAPMEFQGSMAQNTHIVGDGFGWVVPQNDGFYAKWASQQKFHVNTCCCLTLPPDFIPSQK